MDYYQLIGSFIAITVLALVARWLFPVRTPLNDDRIARNLARCFPGMAFGSPVLSKDGQVALVPQPDDSGKVGLVRQMGDRIVCRMIDAGQLSSLEERGTSLVFHFHDFTQPSVTFEKADGDAARLNAIVQTLQKVEAQHAA